MKNLKIYIIEIQDQSGQYLDADIEPPKFERWHHHSTYHSTDGIWPHNRVKRIIEKYIGKQFDKAFSEYCAKVPVYQQFLFLEEFNPPKYHYWRNTYRVDKQGNIQKVKAPKKDKRAYYFSDDYKTELRHKVTNRLKPNSYTSKFIKGVKTYYDHASYYPYKSSTDKDYVEVCVKGYKQVFSSHKDREYRRLITQQQKRQRKAQKLRYAEREAISYNFLTKSEQKLKEEKAIDFIKILKHGFDPKTSFQGNGVNPDIIKLEQGF